jgi:hypothetical protein
MNPTGKETGQKRETGTAKKTGITVTEILIIAVLIAAGAVLKSTANTIFAFTPLKPNMVIAMYGLAILLIKPRFFEGLSIGLIAGVICMFLPGVAVPYANVVSETIGALTMVLLMKIPFDIKIKKLSFRPAILTFFTTLASGFSFFAMLNVLILSGMDIHFMGLGVFGGIILGTAAANAVIVFILFPALSPLLKGRNNG